MQSSLVVNGSESSVGKASPDPSPDLALWESQVLAGIEVTTESLVSEV